MGAGHGHAHGRRREQDRKRLALVLVLVATYMVAEVIGAVISDSLALLADAGHMLSDVAALGLSLFAIWVAGRPAPTHRTFGYYRTEILAALVNGSTLVAIALFIFVEAYRRFANPPRVLGGTMLAIAVGGLLINLVGLKLLGDGRSDSLNIRGAWLHVLSDTLGSLGVIVAGALIWVFGWDWADPAASVLVGILILYSSWMLLRETVAVLMEAAPGHIDVDEVRNAIVALPDVVAVHDLHIWTITSGLVSLSAHIVVRALRPRGTILAQVRRLLHERFHIDHLTIQVEPEEFEEHRAAI